MNENGLSPAGERALRLARREDDLRDDFEEDLPNPVPNEDALNDLDAAVRAVERVLAGDQAHLAPVPTALFELAARSRERGGITRADLAHLGRILGLLEMLQAQIEEGCYYLREAVHQATTIGRGTAGDTRRCECGRIGNDHLGGLCPVGSAEASSGVFRLATGRA